MESRETEKIKVPVVDVVEHAENNDEPLLGSEGQAAPAVSSFQNINTDIHNVVFEPSAAEFVDDNEFMKVLANQLIEEYNQQYKYKLDQDLYFARTNGHERRTRSHERDQ